ncbi:MAG TPA: hypothetical protein VK465_03460 [Fibrobacteria bacterium]|nr:hypothetical protein [Fibrobacteria bacterium]
MDMYASDMIYMIFKNIQEEYELNRMLLTESRRQNAHSDSMPARQSWAEKEEARPRPESAGGEKVSDIKNWVWTGIALAAVAAGVGTYYLISAEPQTTVTQKETDLLVVNVGENSKIRLLNSSEINGSNNFGTPMPAINLGDGSQLARSSNSSINTAIAGTGKSCTSSTLPCP